MNRAGCAGGVEPFLATLLAVAVVSLVSLVGIATFGLPGLRKHRTILVLVALSAGTLMGDAFFHLLPEAVEARAGDHVDAIGAWMLLGFLALFLMEVALRARHSHVDPQEHHPHEGEGAIAPFAWTNLVGDGLHNFLDGAAIAAAFLVDTGVGVATSIAVVVHEVPQELGDFAVLVRAGVKPGRALLWNFLSAAIAFAGALVVLLLDLDPATIDAYGLPFIAGAFIYIAAADLIPELHHHSKGREAATILGGFVGGIAIMYLLLYVERSGLL